MSLSAGRLRHFVRIERKVQVGRNAQGAALVTWSLVDRIWMSIEPLSAREFIAAAADQSKVVARGVARFRSDIDATCRVVDGSNIYNIEGVLPDKDSGLEYMTMPLSRFDGNTQQEVELIVDGGGDPL